MRNLMTIKKYKTPVSKLIRFFEKSRDKWRTKTKEAKYQIKLLRKRNKYLEKNKNIYKAHNKEGNQMRAKHFILNSCPSYLFVLPEIIDNSLSLDYSPPHYGNYTFYNFRLYILADSGQRPLP